MTTDRGLSIGVVGAGTAYQNLHLPVLKQLGITVSWLAGTSIERLTQAAGLTDEMGLGRPDISTDYRRQLDRGGLVDAVLVAVPMSHTDKVACDVARSGHHALVEKPLASTVSGARKLITLFEDQNLAVVAGENFRYQKRFHEANRLVSRGAVGVPRLYFLNDLHYTSADSLYAKTAWRRAGGYEGGYLYDGGTHIVAGMRTMVGHPVTSVSALTTAVHPEYLSGFDDTMLINLSFASGVVGHLALGYGVVDRESRTPKVYGDEGTLAILPGSIELWRHDGEVETLAQVDKSDMGFRAEWELLASAVADSSMRSVAMSDAQESVLDLAVLEAALASSRSGEVRTPA